MTTSGVAPLAGDAAMIRSSADRWSTFAGAADIASGDVRRVDSGDFQGDEADLYRERLHRDLPPHLDTTSQAWTAVSSALTAYATTLENLQHQVAALSGRAADEQSHVDAAQAAVDDACTADTRYTADQQAQAAARQRGGEAPPDTYRSQTAAANSQLGAATSALQRTTDVANQLHAQHNAAVDACVSAINTAAGLRFQEPPGFWGRLGNAVGGWIRDHADVLKAVSGVLKQISSIAGLLAMIPVLAPVMGPIAAATGTGAMLIDSAVKVATGEGSWTDIVVDAAGAIPGGGVAGGAARGARTAAETHAAVGAVSSAATVTKDAAGAGRVAADRAGTAVTGADRTGGRAVESADSAVAHDTPLDELPCVGDPIDVITGQMVLQQTDLVLPAVLPLVLKRVYKSGYRWGGRFGRSWASTLDQRVEVGADGTACFVAEDGVVLHYSGVDEAANGARLLPTEGIQRWPLRRHPDGSWSVEDPERRVTRRFATPDGHGCCALTEIGDAYGNSIEFRYGAGGVVEEIRHSGGYRVLVSTAGPLVTALSVREGTDRSPVASFDYDGHAQLVGVHNADGIPLTLQWESGRIVGWHDRNDIWYRYDYDESDRCVRTAGRGRVLSYGFSYLPGRTLVTNSLGAVTTYEYNAAHQLVRTIDPLGNVTASTWDRYDRLLLRTDALGDSTRLDYDGAGRLVGVGHPDGTRERMRRNDAGDVVELIDANGGVWSRTYDFAGAVVSAEDPLHGLTRLAHTPRGAVAAVTDALGGVTTVRSNAAGLPVWLADPVGAVTELEYDGWGRLVRSVDPVGGVTSLGWTAEGRLSYRIDPDGAREDWIWDQEGNVTSHVDATGATTVIETGVFDLPVGRVGPDGARLIFGYDTELRLTSVQDPVGLRWRYEYDAAGRLAAETDFNGRTQRYRHDAVGRVVGVINGVGEQTSLIYDSVGNLVQRRSGDDLTELVYDRAGQLVAARSAGAVVDLERDACGRVIRETVNGRTVAVEFDAAGRRISRLTPAGVLSQWQFDSAGHPRSMTTAGQRVEFVHDAAGREVTRSFSAGGRIEQRYDASHRLIGQLVTSAAGASAPSIARTFDYRVDGTLTGVLEAVTSETRRFDVDVVGRIVGVRAADWKERYVYDRSGKVTQATLLEDRIGGGDVTAEPDSAADPQQRYAGTLVLETGRVSYGYDGQGRMVTRSRKRLSQKAETWQFRYDTDDRLVAAMSGGRQWTYTYDAFGRRLSKQQSGPEGRSSSRRCSPGTGTG